MFIYSRKYFKDLIFDFQKKKSSESECHSYVRCYYRVVNNIINNSVAVLQTAKYWCPEIWDPWSPICIM